MTTVLWGFSGKILGHRDGTGRTQMVTVMADMWFQPECKSQTVIVMAFVACMIATTAVAMIIGFSYFELDGHRLSWQTLLESFFSILNTILSYFF